MRLTDKVIGGAALLILCLSADAQTGIYQNGWIDLNKNGEKDVYEDPAQPIQKRIENLLSQMTLEEKTAQMATLYGFGRVLKDELPNESWKKEIWKDGIANIDEHLNSLPYHPKATSTYSFPHSKHASAINTVQKWFVEETRLGIPVDFTNEAIHGLTHDRATPFPAPIAIGSSWNKSLVRWAGTVAGREAKALGYTNIYAPILDLARDPRWGRVVECYGEDPFLVAELGKQMVVGIQEEGVAATLKHYAAYSVPKGGRDGDARTDPHIAPRELHNIYLYPFERVIKEARPMGVMSSYNDWDGVPVTASRYFLTTLLRFQYGFTGYVVSDSEAVEFIESKHHVADSYKTAVKMAVEAGLNVRTHFTAPEDFVFPLRELVREGAVSIHTVNERVADVLRVKFSLGLFDQPYVKDVAAADTIVRNADARALSLQLSREAMVLLKNEHDVLPLQKNKLKNILVTGPLAAETNHSVSRYGPSNIEVISVLAGIESACKNQVNVRYEKGCDIVDANWPESEIIPTDLTPSEKAAIEKAVRAAKQVDVIIAVMGEDEQRVGESKSRTSLGLPGKQLDLLRALYATGKPVVLVLINGQPLTINWENRYLTAILEAWFPGEQGGKAVAEVLFGDYNPGGKLPVTFPRTIGQIELNFPYKPGSHAGQPGDGPNGFGKTAAYGALYPFGHGLSYTKFEYSNLTIDPVIQQTGGQITVTATIRNTGSRTGDEVVQLYVKDKVSSVTQYEMQLRGFERMRLDPGVSKTVQFLLTPDHLSILDINNNKLVEPGEFEVLLGSSSEDIRLSGGFQIK